MKTPLITAIASLVLGGYAFSQEDNDPAFGHSVHGEAFNEGPRQSAVLIPGTGEVAFPVTTATPRAQAFFNQGVGQLHGFWDFEAERSFRQVAAIDPGCAMAYWGMAMANFSNDKRAKGFSEQASKRKASASEREKQWIEAYAKYFENEKPEAKVRLRNLVRSLEAIVEEFPDDLEAKAFLLKQLYYNNGKGHPISSHLTVNLLAKEILSKQPNHPANHYRIHLWDGEKPENALDSAAACGPSAPAIAHMWHMPGHIYSKLKRYDDAVWQQEASARIDHAHMMRYRIVPDRIHNFAHNNEWLIRNLNFLGRVDDAIDLACNMIELPRLAKFKDKTEIYSHSGGSWTYGRQRLRDTLLQFGLWKELLAFGDSPYLAPDEDTIDAAEWHRFMGIASFETGAVAKGGEHLEAIEKGLADVKEKQAKAAESAEEKAVKAKKKEPEVKKAVEAARKNFAKKIEAHEKAIKEVKAYALAHGTKADCEEAIKLLGELEGMSKSRKALLLSKAGDAKAAIRLIGEEVKASANQVAPLATQAFLLWEAGREEPARKAFARLRRVGGHADAALPEFTRLEPIVADLGIEGDWRRPKKPAKDLGERPPLDSMGPFRWEPPEAPDWTLADAEGDTVSLADYRGRPVVVIFYLGKGCTHCMEQLNAFAPLHEKYAEAGIELVAVSTDSPEGLRATYQASTDDEKNPFPFPLVSDVAGLETFRKYRAYDDFEEMALHGTYLIDGAGRIRWQEISYEPFMHPEFLLEECVRLLSGDDS